MVAMKLELLKRLPRGAYRVALGDRKEGLALLALA
jgi:hypothetical protein